ncbi:MbeD family mobilization/exclusion protein [Vibrio parahaemolyticus]|uniref:MbeD family mobilization/exclusion protein n=1 Tax=unclassified Vibrio TaxID=2614977 RepID=UPI002A1ED12B|nr:MbeD family mobilization/exclusion protein [Vibrio parahaemolyticus]MDG2570549.1 MbeD family mobilization/exclusion protein [Vibrio parahaemolyticus]
MTELETQLLNAFEQLQTQHEKQHNDFVTSYNGLVQMFETTSKENSELRQQVSNLSRQVESLSAHLLQLEKRYNKNNR